MKYKCVSRRFLGRTCEYSCEVETSFEPVGCLRSPIWQTWEAEDLELAIPLLRTWRRRLRTEMATWSYGERVCLLCGRPAYPTDYYPPDFMETNRSLVIPLCQYHKGTYMAHGLKKLDEMYREGKLREAEVIQ